MCECGPSDSSVPHLSPTALSRDPLPGPLCREEGRHPRHLPTLNSTSAFEHFLYFNGNLSEKLLHSFPHTATYKKEFSLALLSLQILLPDFSLPLALSAGTCNYLMPGRQVLSRGVRPGASWQLGMIRRILEFCHWSPWCSPRRPGCLVVTATIAALNLLTGRNSSRPRWLCSPKQQALRGVGRRTQGPGNGLLRERQNFCSSSGLCSSHIRYTASSTAAAATFYSWPPLPLFIPLSPVLTAFCKTVQLVMQGWPNSSWLGSYTGK